MAGSNFKKDVNQNDVVDSAKAFGFSFGILFLVFVLFLVASIIYPPKHGEEAKGGEAGGTTNINAEQIVKQSCTSCHGQNLEGMVGPALANIGSQLDEKAISDVIKNGKGSMPKGILKDAKEISAVSKWLSEKK
ncbi:cytochrome c [Brevibacillus laterosporus]|uniref:c-type cytochrome n=1 Tax=Brevibacillus laterosporus TaxID=1465 RepID=UPI0003B199B7|nr:cytochrome c [Brevibacillus laterosporus]ERM17758.1 cytochrome C [Brevibacillus laterosporus PE36]MDF9413506.1 cytochrome c [Brevibacillus laterosporus]